MFDMCLLGPYKIYKSRKALPTNCQHTHASILEVEVDFLVGFFSIVHPEGNGFTKTGENDGGYIVGFRYEFPSAEITHLTKI